MSIPEPVIEFTRMWWLKAAEDLDAARASRHLPSVCCFHSQQAVEKAIKSLLVLYQTDFEKSHDIGRLLVVLGRTPASPPKEITEGLDGLTHFAVEMRYPPASATQQEAVDALDKATKFLVWVRTTLPASV